MSGPYELVLADPPWRYNFSRSKSRRVENQYPTMTHFDICSLLAFECIEVDDDAALFLWSTAPKLTMALDVMDAWGFCYKTNLVWDKEKIGMGYWARGQHELLLVGTRGHMPPPAVEHRIASVWREPRGRHSAKPVGIKLWLGTAFRDLRKIELFARETHEGWDHHGLEVAT